MENRIVCRKIRERSNLEKVIVFLIVIIIWQLSYSVGVGMLGVWKAYAMPSPYGVLKCFIEMSSMGILFEPVLRSLIRGIYGYTISCIIGMSLGLIVNRNQIAYRNIKPLLAGIQALPSICWVPFSILWYGLSEKAIIFVVIMGSAFGMATAFDSAIRNVSPIYIKAAQTMGANERQLFFRVIIPASIPEMVSGLRHGWSFAWRALMSGEVMTTCVGLGQALVNGRNLLDINQVMLIMIIIVLVGMIIDNIFFSNLEKHMIKGV